MPVDADPAGGVGWQTFLEFSPGLAAVGRLVKSAAGTPFAERIIAVDAVGLGHIAGPTVVPVALSVPKGGDQRFGVGRMHHEVDDAGSVIDVKYFLPRLAAVGRFVNP